MANYVLYLGFSFNCNSITVVLSASPAGAALHEENYYEGGVYTVRTETRNCEGLNSIDGYKVKVHSAEHFYIKETACAVWIANFKNVCCSFLFFSCFLPVNFLFQLTNIIECDVL